jgi:hypothetical protein
MVLKNRLNIPFGVVLTGGCSYFRRFFTPFAIIYFLRLLLTEGVGVLLFLTKGWGL